MSYLPDLRLPALDPGAEVRVMEVLIRKHTDEARRVLGELDGRAGDDAGDPDE
jgi:hypothetical protein